MAINVQQKSRARDVIALANNDTFFQGFNNTIERSIDPLVSGYAFIKFTKEVTWVDSEYPGFFRLLEKNLKSFSGAQDFELATVSETAGFTGTEHAFAGGITKGTGFSMAHNEYSGSPIATGYEHWISHVRDPNTNIATYPRKYGVDYTQQNHTAQMMYIVTRPDANNTEADIIEHAVFISNIMPTRIMNNHFAFQTGQVSEHQLEQNFTGDFFKGARVFEAARAIVRDSLPYSFVGQDEVDPNVQIAG